MASIIVLDENTANQIAAGEVVERPVSVVKELVENSVDAGAGRIVIDLKEGGVTTITVTDDGCGMSAEDLQLAFQRHATSKITCVSDLRRVVTLGFRGEALPSIATVSRLNVTTRTHDNVSGNSLEVIGGSLQAILPAGCPPGTNITVRDLFFNTPARRKAMKSFSTESALIGDLVSRMAMARPDISYELRMNGRRVFFSTGSGNLIDSVTAVYGAHRGRELLPFRASNSFVALEGFAGKPSFNRSNRSHITIIINGRYVRSPVISGAVEEAYRTLLPHGRRPVAVISSIIDPELLDINVHPAKMEVRLLEEENVTRLVTTTLRDALKNKEIIPSPTIEKPKVSAPGPDWSQVEAQQLGTSKQVSEFRHDCPDESSICAEEQPIPDYSFINQSGSDNGEIAVKEVEECDGASKGFPVLTALAQLSPTYILAEGQDGLYIIDQHAAHERILYEEFLKHKKKTSQYLLTPITLELNYKETALFTQRVLWFTDAGFIIEHFGGNTFLLRGVPLDFPAGQEEGFFLDMLDYVRERGSGANQVEFIDRLASTLACRNAIKAGEKLSLLSMDTLLSRLSGTDNPYTCPHGRPTVIHLSNRDLEARFKR